MRVEAWPLSSNGLMYDRGWALVDAAGKAITQKAHPRLVLVQPTINLQDRVMVVRAPGMSEDLVVPIANSSMGSAKCSGRSISSAVCAGNVISSHSNSCYN
jgi:molybdenum cofactor sulfurtransferase